MSASPGGGSQSGFAYRFDWGLEGLRALAPGCEVVVVVDTLRFTTAVSAAVDAGAVVYPFRWKDERAAEHAREHDAVLAGFREDGGPSLSPTDLLGLAPDTRIVLPSPNGSTVAFEAVAIGVPVILAGSLRNAAATARRARALAGDGAIAVIASGERWDHAAGPLRPSLEDLVGAGAVLAALEPASNATDRRCSPEAAAARAAFDAVRSSLDETLLSCTSGRELVDRGWQDDVLTAAQLDVSSHAAQLVGDAFVAV